MPDADFLPRMHVDPATYYDADYWAGRKRYRQPNGSGSYEVKTYDPPGREWAGFGVVVEGVLDALAPWVPRTALDVGCGCGSLVAHLARAGVDARGVDVSDDAVARPAPGADGRVSKWDISAGVPAGGPFDLVTATDLLEHVYATEIDGVVRAIMSCCAPDGVGFFCVATMDPRRAAHEEFVHPSADVPIPLEREWQAVAGHVNVRPHGYWVALFERLGYVADWRVMHLFAQHWAGDQRPGQFGSTVQWGPRFILAARPAAPSSASSARPHPIE